MYKTLSCKSGHMYFVSTIQEAITAESHLYIQQINCTSHTTACIYVLINKVRCYVKDVQVVAISTASQR